MQVQSAYKPQELGKEDWAVISQSPPWAVDAWGLGCLVQEAFSGRELSRTEDLRNLVPIPKTVAQVNPLNRATCCYPHTCSFLPSL